MAFALATWNVNSIRVRQDQVLAWLEEHQPDVLALQELKAPSEAFPYEAFRALGYEAAVSGQATYNGVAILSRHPLEAISPDMPGYADTQKRVLAVTVAGIRVVCVYIPNGASLDSDKYTYKLEWLEQFMGYAESILEAYPQTVILGDYNIAPSDADVHDPKAWQGQVLVSEPERAYFKRLLDLGFSDAFRSLSGDLKAYSWWDYRMNAFKRDLGLRIDHILVSAAVMEKARTCFIDKLPRGLERPSDHTPVILELELG